MSESIIDVVKEMTAPITREIAHDLMVEFYTDVYAQEDPEWWEEMIQVLLQQETAWAARKWLEA